MSRAALRPLLAATRASTRALAAPLPRPSSTALALLRPSTAWLAGTGAQQVRGNKTASASGDWVRKRRRGEWADSPLIDYHELRPLVEQPSDDVVLIDVREPEEVNAGHIPSSVNIPMSELKEAFDPKFAEGEFKKRYSLPRPLPSQKLVVYCRSGKRSAAAAEELGQLGWTQVRNYQGSWLDWEARMKEKQAGRWEEDDD